MVPSANALQQALLPRITSSANCSARSTACCSSSSPKTVVCSFRRGYRVCPPTATSLITPPPAFGASPAATVAPPMATVGSSFRLSSVSCAWTLAANPSGCRPWAAFFSAKGPLRTSIPLRSPTNLYATLRALCLVRDPEEKITRVTDFDTCAEELGSIYESLLELRLIRFEISAGFAELGDADGTGNEPSSPAVSTPRPASSPPCSTPPSSPVIDRALATARGTASKSSNGSKSAKTADGSPSPPAAAGEGRGEVGSSTAHCALRTPHSSEAGSDYTTVAEKALLGMQLRPRLRLRAFPRRRRSPNCPPCRRPPDRRARTARSSSALRLARSRCPLPLWRGFNPLSVELCKVSIWLEAFEPGRPLAFLDGHIQCGN